MFGSLIKSKHTSEIVREFMLKYVQSGGLMPDKLWSDCGGEFNSTMLKDLCENLNVEVATGPGYTPTSNAVVERHHAVVDRILEKMLEERPNIDAQEALGWALHAHNSYPGTHGWSPFQLTYGRNPRIPGVGNDRLPALTGTVTEVVASHINNLLSAQKNYREAVNLKKIKTALAHKIRSIEKEYVSGDKVYFKRENLKQGDRNKWSGPATVIGKHGNIYYISHQSSLLRVSPQRLIGIHEAENISADQVSDQTKADQPSFSNPEDHMDFEVEQLEVVSSQERGEAGQNEDSFQDRRDENCGKARDNVEQEDGEQHEEEQYEDAQEMIEDTSQNKIGEEVTDEDKGGDKEIDNEGDRQDDKESESKKVDRDGAVDEDGAGEDGAVDEDGAGELGTQKVKVVNRVTNMMKNKIPIEGEPDRPPKAGDTIQYLDKEGEWQKVTVINRYSKRSAWMNVENEEGQKAGVDLATGNWKYSVLAAEGIHDPCITFIFILQYLY